MKQSLWEEIKAERRQLWCEAALLAMQNTDPIVYNNTTSPAEVADKLLEAYDARFSYDLTDEQKRQKEGDKRRPGHSQHRGIRADDALMDDCNASNP